MATADTLPPLPNILKPQPENTHLNLKPDTVPDDLPFDPVALKHKYLEERNKRLRDDGGIEQYRPVEGTLSHYVEDPYLQEKIKRDPIDDQCEVLVIGGGYGGQLVAVELLQAGIKDVRIVEKAGDYGGTWYWNRYPGAQCDIESYVYMPLCEDLKYVPTEKYAHAQELLAHARRIGQHFGLYDKTLFQTEVHSLHWDGSASRWAAKTNRGDNIRARFVVPAAGPLHRPKLPGLSGIESFKGHSFHSSRWDYDYTGGDLNGNLTKLANKKIGIIGTGATAVQIVPHLGQSAKEVYVFQRTPSSIDVRNNAPTAPEWQASLSSGWQRHRMDNFNTIVNGGHQEVDLVSDGWTDIIRNLLPGKADSTVLDPAAAATKRQIADFKKMESVRARVDQIVQDPVTAESLKPYYNQFCKRPCFHDEYLQTFNRPNVHLIDTKGAGVIAITPTGIVAADQTFDLDCIIYATGFELSTAWSHRSGIEIYGSRDGQTITQKWARGASTLHGWSTRNFPNCFFISHVQAALTPNFIHITHEQARHVAYVISTCHQRNVKTVQPTAAAEEAWTAEIVEKAQLRRDFNRECTPGYYNNEGKPSAVAAKSASYGAGALAFLDILDKWRKDDRLEGLDVEYWDV